MSTFLPADFKGIAPDETPKYADPRWQSPRLDALKNLLMAAEQFRRPTLQHILALAAYRRNRSLSVAEDAASTAAATRMGLVEKQGHVPMRYYQMPVGVGMSERAKAQYGALALDFEVARMTVRDEDLVVSEVAMTHANRVEKPLLDAIKWPFVDMLVWQLRPIAVASWDPTSGVEMRSPVLTRDAKYKKGTRTIENRIVPVPQGVEPFYHRIDENGAPMFECSMTGAVEYEPVSPLHYLIDPLCGWRGVRNARYLIRQSPVDAAYVWERFAGNEDVQEALRNWPNWLTGLAVNDVEAQIMSLYRMTTANDYLRSAVLNEAWLRPMPNSGLPRGLHVYFITPSAGGEVSSGIEHGLVLSWRELPPPYEIPAEDDAVEIGDTTNYFGDVYSRLNFPLNRALNIAVSAQIAGAENANRRRFGAAGVQKLEIETLPFDGDAIECIKSPDQNAKFYDLTANPSALLSMQVQQMLLSGMQMSSNASPSMTNPDELATQAKRALLYEASVTNVVKERVAMLMSKLCLRGLRGSQLYHTIPQLMALFPELDRGELETFKRADLRWNTQVKLRQSTFFAGNPQARMDFLARLAQAKELAEKHMDVQQLRELLNYRDELGPSEEDRDIELAEHENSEMRRNAAHKTNEQNPLTEDGSFDPRKMYGPLRNLDNDGNEVNAGNFGVNDVDNDEAHIRVHRRPLKDPNRGRIHPRYKLFLMWHIGAHEASKAQKQKAAAMAAGFAQVEAQGAMGQIEAATQPGGSPGRPQMQG